VLYKIESEQVLHLDFVDFLGPVPFELLKGFDLRKACGADSTLGSAVFSLIDFVPIIVSHMSSDEFFLVIDAWPIRIDFHCQGLAGKLSRHTVAIGIQNNPELS